jgi:hypothetical protein
VVQSVSGRRAIILIVVEDIPTCASGGRSSSHRAWLEVVRLVMIDFKHSINISDDKDHVDKVVDLVITSQAGLVFKLIHHLSFYDRIVRKDSCCYGLGVPACTSRGEIFRFIGLIGGQQLAENTFIAHLDDFGIYLRPEEDVAVL